MAAFVLFALELGFLVVKETPDLGHIQLQSRAAQDNGAEMRTESGYSRLIKIPAEINAQAGQKVRFSGLRVLTSAFARRPEE